MWSWALITFHSLGLLMAAEHWWLSISVRDCHYFLMNTAINTVSLASLSGGQSLVSLNFTMPLDYILRVRNIDSGLPWSVLVVLGQSFEGG